MSSHAGPSQSKPPPRPLPSAAPPNSPLPLLITIRFSTSLPDLHLDVPEPHQTTVVALRYMIREKLASQATSPEHDDDDDYSDHDRHDTRSEKRISKDKAPLLGSQGPAKARLRLIHNGRVLPDTAVLSSVLKMPPPPPPASDPKGKGKAVLRPIRIFINCSIGDPLTSEELDAEREAAVSPLPSSPPSTSTTGGRTPLKLDTTSTSPHRHPQEGGEGARPTRPQGFDRLLQSGFTPSEIATLRSHFRAIHTARFTPDTMPSPDTLRAMEDAWLDNNSSSSAPSGSLLASSNTAGGGYIDDGEEGTNIGIEDAYGLSAIAGSLIQGMLMGFVWPLGVIGWLGKEDGVWSRRMQVFAGLGVVLSLSVGVVRGLTGEG